MTGSWRRMRRRKLRAVCIVLSAAALACICAGACGGAAVGTGAPGGVGAVGPGAGDAAEGFAPGGLAADGLGAGDAAERFSPGGVIGRTYAYYTGTFGCEGTVTVGHCDIAIRETGYIPEGIPAGEAFTVDDTVTVVNTGTLPCYIRAAVDYDSYISDGASRLVGMDERWIYDSDSGYYCYADVLEPDEESGPLMSGIDVDALPDDAAARYRVGIYVEAIDAVGGGADW